MKKLICLILAVFMITALTACKSTAESTEVQDTLPSEVQKSYSFKKIPTYSESGEYFFSTTEIPAFIDDNAGFRLSALNGKFAFSADCEGDVSLELLTRAVSNTADIATMKVYIDGGEAKIFNLIYLKQNLKIAEGLERGVHTFVIEKTSGGDLFPH